GALSGYLDAGNTENMQKVIVGTLILLFLIREPEGLARLVTATWRRLFTKKPHNDSPTARAPHPAAPSTKPLALRTFTHSGEPTLKPSNKLFFRPPSYVAYALLL